MATAQRTQAPRGVVKRLLLGRALATNKQEHQLLPKLLALPILSSDALSSVAYATEEMMLVLALAGAAALSSMLPIGGAIALLLAIVVTSYRQTVRAYPRGGGSYIVSKENLGTLPGLIAAAAILTDYVLTVAVSVTAGTVAVVSAAPVDRAVPGRGRDLVHPARSRSLNLRGVKEAGTLFAVPTYGFVDHGLPDARGRGGPLHRRVPRGGHRGPGSSRWCRRSACSSCSARSRPARRR